MDLMDEGNAYGRSTNHDPRITTHEPRIRHLIVAPRRRGIRRMARTVALYLLAHGRSGDKGDAVNIGVIARRPEWYEFLKERLNPELVGRFLGSMAKGPVERFEMPNLHALNFIVHGALGGGGSVALQLDAQGKTYSHALLRLPITISEEMLREAMAHHGGEPPEGAFDPAPFDEESGHEPLVSTSRDKRVGIITLNRAKKRNALNAAMLTQLASAARKMAADPLVKVVILAGAGPSFCAGMDLKYLSANWSHANVRHVAQGLCDACLALYQIPQPVIAAVQGGALGGGTALALTADYLILESGTKLGFPEVRLGFVPGLVSVMAARRLPACVARAAMLDGRGIDAQTAHRHGWAQEVAGSAEGDTTENAVLRAAKARAADWVRNCGDRALRQTKRIVAAGELPGLERDLQSAVETFVAVGMEEPFAMGRAAFLAGEAPDWSNA